MLLPPGLLYLHPGSANTSSGPAAAPGVSRAGGIPSRLRARGLIAVAGHSMPRTAAIPRSVHAKSRSPPTHPHVIHIRRQVDDRRGHGAWALP